MKPLTSLLPTVEKAPVIKPITGEIARLIAEPMAAPTPDRINCPAKAVPIVTANFCHSGVFGSIFWEMLLPNWNPATPPTTPPNPAPALTMPSRRAALRACAATSISAMRALFASSPRRVLLTVSGNAFNASRAERTESRACPAAAARLRRAGSADVPVLAMFTAIRASTGTPREVRF